ncbi:Senecionine N-oxygenase [Teratosphaeriaceae sp. CCFEE 6253]|nr:Senecionine N-oxygenase [Teratosphaeriaceae sp. CCFEE 6253]
MTNLTVGVLALQGAFAEHLALLRQAAELISRQSHAGPHSAADADAPADADADADISPHRSTLPRPDTDVEIDIHFHFCEVRTPPELARCDALILPGGESTSIALIAARTGLLAPLRDFVTRDGKPVWGTCAGLILLAARADRSKATGQELIGGLDVRVRRNYFGRQVESFAAELAMPFLADGRPFHAVFIRAPVVEEVLTPSAVEAAALVDGETVHAPPTLAARAPVEILGRLPGRAKTIKDQAVTARDLGEEGDIVAVRQGNVFGTAFHPELTADCRIHAWWLGEVVKAVANGGLVTWSAEVISRIAAAQSVVRAYERQSPSAGH